MTWSGLAPFSKMDEVNLSLIGRVLGSALHWKNEYEKIYIDATHDGLSGLLYLLIICCKLIIICEAIKRGSFNR